MIEMVVAAAGLGFAGGLHCAAMCGPIAAAGCTSAKSTGSYVFGRLVSYAFLGSLFGAFGEHLVHRGLGAIQDAALFSLAAIMIARGIALLRAPKSTGGLVQIRKRSRLREIVALLPIPKRGLGLGLVTGVLPCGVLFAGWLLAARSADPSAGALTMLALGVASMPGLFVPVLFSRFVSSSLSPARVGLMWCLLGGFVALRPLLETFHCAGGH